MMKKQYQQAKRGVRPCFPLGMKIIKSQIVLLIGFTGFFLVNIDIGKALLSGGAIAFVATLILYTHLFKYEGAQQARNILNSLYRAEFVKMLTITLGFLLVFKGLNPVYPGCVIVGFVIVQLTYWMIPMLDLWVLETSTDKY